MFYGTSLGSYYQSARTVHCWIESFIKGMNPSRTNACDWKVLHVSNN
ncbi:hypothetical protein P7D97_00220 [Enterococcus raffinosus]|nr:MULTISPECIES: hypothetical protein [Enterococcus]MDT2570022.1 hypothetical protein [Enterococcus raffinosus]